MSVSITTFEPGDPVLADGKPGRVVEEASGFVTVMLAGGEEVIKKVAEVQEQSAAPLVEEDGEHLRFLCDADKGGCGDMIDAWAEEPVKPGQAAVVKCDNCELSWSVWNPPFDTIPTDQFEAIWPIIGQ
jgi:hypothetical protein